jgi:hypothetical protein
VYCGRSFFVLEAGPRDRYPEKVLRENKLADRADLNGKRGTEHENNGAVPGGGGHSYNGLFLYQDVFKVINGR